MERANHKLDYGTNYLSKKGLKLNVAINYLNGILTHFLLLLRRMVLLSLLTLLTAWLFEKIQMMQPG